MKKQLIHSPSQAKLYKENAILHSIGDLFHRTYITVDIVLKSDACLIIDTITQVLLINNGCAALISVSKKTARTQQS